MHGTHVALHRRSRREAAAPVEALVGAQLRQSARLVRRPQQRLLTAAYFGWTGFLAGD